MPGGDFRLEVSLGSDSGIEPDFDEAQEGFFRVIQ
jgi:hypothetical protein